MKHSIIYLNAFPDKKIKSLGNKGLIKISHNKYLIDYNLSMINKFYNNSNIIVVGGFESKKLLKYLTNSKAFTKSKNDLNYIEHQPDDRWNIGKSIYEALINNETESATIYNSSLFLDPKIFITAKKQTSSFVLCKSGKADGVGCVTNNNLITQCFYGLENTIYDFLYLDKNALSFLKKHIINSNIDKLYLFEIINLCVDNNIEIKLVNINKKFIQTIDSIQSINSIKQKQKKHAK